MAGIVGLTEGIVQRGPAEGTPQQQQAVQHELSVAAVQEKRLQQKREVSKPRKSADARIEDRDSGQGGQHGSRKKRRGQPEKPAPESMAIDEAPHVIDIRV